MSDEDIIITERRLALGGGQDGFELALETLIAIAEHEGRDFLAYLLTMALVHAREEGEDGERLPSLGH
jgi:hypothetical protein